MNKEDTKTLHVSVYDAVKVSDSYKEKGFQTELVERPVFLVFVDSVLDSLFSGVQTFARPPTSQLNFGNFSRNHLAY